jgi:hypothetical protein
MRPESFSADLIVRLLRRRTIATMDELKAALGSSVDLTVFRKLRTLSYLASYSHRGRFYALLEAAAFDARGLWTCRGVHFSRFGSLVDTVEVFVNRAGRGYRASELASELQVGVKEPLLKLVRVGRVTREDVAGLYLYCSAERNRCHEQRLARTLPVLEEPAFSPLREPASDSNEAKAAVVLFMSLLDEQQRRLFAGLESLRLGWGGDRAVAEATGMDPHTIAKGRQELLAHDVLVDRRRRPGGGRKPVEKKRRRSSPKSRG